MGAIKRHFANQFKLRNCFLECESASDFHVCCWQKNRSALPLLLIRTIIFFGCLATLFASFILIVQDADWSAGYWFIYMTHWGLVINTFNSGFAFAVSCKAYYKGPCKADFGLPWYLKVFWVFDEIAVTISFFITVFYWTVLASSDVEYAVDPVLDIFIHVINSVLMFLLLVTSRHPLRILHLYCPVAFGIIYVIFSVIYYYAGGTDPFGNEFVYPVLDWSQPGQSAVLVVICAVIIIIFHAIVVALSQIRDSIARRIRKNADTISISNNDGYN